MRDSREPTWKARGWMALITRPDPPSGVYPSMVVQPVRSLNHPDIAYFVFDAASRSAGVIDAADDRLVTGLIEAYGCRLDWVTATREAGDLAEPLSRIASRTGAATAGPGRFHLGTLAFESRPLPGSSHRLIRGPRSLFPGRLLEAGDVPDYSRNPADPAVRELLAVMRRLPRRTRIYPARGPRTTAW